MITGQKDVPFARDALNGILNQQDKELEEHLICAGMVCLSKLNEPQTVKKIGKKLAYEKSYIVRKTAKNLLIGMEGDTVEQVIKEILLDIDDKMKEVMMLT